MYTVDYFIERFSKIPEDKWCVESCENEKGQRCVIGHLNAHLEKNNPAFDALTELFLHHLDSYPYIINNGGSRNFYQQPTPKQRILVALQDIKKLQEEETRKREPKETVKEVIRYVSVTAEIREDAKEKILETSN